MKIFISFIILLFHASNCTFAQRTCFTPERIVESLQKGVTILHYNKKDYTIDQSTLPEDKQITPQQKPITIKDGIRTESKNPENKRIEIKCTYPIDGMNESIVVTRIHRTCFRPDKIIQSLLLGEATLNFNKKEYKIDQSDLKENKIEQDKPALVIISGGERTETVLPDGTHQVTCAYTTTKNDSTKESTGKIIVTRVIHPK